MANPVVFVINGPNVNLLGTRQPDVYGKTTYAELEAMCRKRASELGLTIEFRQSNHEGEIVDWIQEARTKAQGIVINPGGLTHSSVSILDAILAANVPTIEVHLTNTHKRDPFRAESYISKGATGVIFGLGPMGYELALEGLAGIFKQQRP